MIQRAYRQSHRAGFIERVHGEHHPELTRVREITEELQSLDNTTHTMVFFQELRTVTKNYAIPNDVCDAFETTYHAPERADNHLTAA